MTNLVYLPTSTSPWCVSVGGAHGGILVRWKVKSKNRWEVIPDPDLCASVHADWGPSLGEVSFDPLTNTCLIGLNSRHGNTWSFTEHASSPEQARDAWVARMEQASFNPMHVAGFDHQTSYSIGCDDMTSLSMVIRHAYSLEWGDRIGAAINEYNRHCVGNGTTGHGASLPSKAAMEAEKRLIWCCDELDDLRRRGVIQRGSLEGDRVGDLHNYASGLLAARAPRRSAVASVTPTTPSASRSVF